MSSSTSKCFTIEPDAIAILAASVPRRLKPPQTVASKRPRDWGKSNSLGDQSTNPANRGPHDALALFLAQCPGRPVGRGCWCRGVDLSRR
jgi:hypothetical protein